MFSQKILITLIHTYSLSTQQIEIPKPQKKKSSMALLRFVCFPSSSLFSNHNQNQNPQFFNHNNPISLSLSLSASFHNRLTKKTNFHILQSAIEATQIENSNDSVQQLEEGSRTRLLAQNIPWTCTEEDIRPLFEKYGTIVDIEVSFIFSFSLFVVFGIFCGL